MKMVLVWLALLRLRPVIQAGCTSVEKVYRDVRILSWQRCGLNAGLPSGKKCHNGLGIRCSEEA